jgi:hypothetical protein
MQAPHDSPLSSTSHIPCCTVSAALNNECAHHECLTLENVGSTTLGLAVNSNRSTSTTGYLRVLIGNKTPLNLYAAVQSVVQLLMDRTPRISAKHSFTQP